MMKQSYALGSVPSRTATGHKTTMGRLLLMTLTLLLAMFAPSAMYAQQVQLTVNEGESTDNFVPIYGYYADAITKSQFIIPATELSTMVYGTIDKLTFYSSKSSVSWGVAEFEVYMAETDETTLSTLADYGSMEKVMNAGTLSISDNQMVVTLDAPYQYMGGNLMIGFLQTVEGTYVSSPWYGVSATGASMGGYGTSIVQRNFLPKTTIDYTPGVAPSVLKPTNLAFSEVGFQSVKLSWTENGDATAWQICLNDDEANPIDANSNPFTLTGLTPETTYTAKVRAKKGSDVSAWSSAVAFTTDAQFPAPTALAANNITANSVDISWTGTANSYNLRYKEDAGLNNDFENSSLGKWTTIDADGDGYGWILGSATGGVYLSEGSSLLGSGKNASQDMIVSGSYSNVVGALTPDNFLISPKVTLGGSISFWAKGQDSSYFAEVFGVAVSTAGNTDPADFMMVGSDFTATSEWKLYTVDLSTYSGEGYIAIRHYNVTDMFVLDVDDIVITEPVERPWMATIANATSPYTIEGLTPETDYEVEVQAVYDEGKSTWAGTKFTTLEDVATPSALAASDITYNTAKLSWTENGDATSWEICLNDDEANLIAADSNPFKLTGLTAETDYTAKVRAVKGEKRSHWSDAISFTTDIQFHAPSDVAAGNITTTSAEISWTTDAVAATATSFELQYAEGNVFGSTLRYDDGTNATNVGNSSSATWTWGVMYPGSMLNGSQLAKVIIYESVYNTQDITIDIYQGGDDAPGTLLYTETVTPVGGFHEVTLATPVAITPGKNLWISLTETGTYVLAACNTSEPNNQWVYSGGTWANIGDLASSLANYGWMIRAEINDGIDPASVTWTSVADATSPAELTGLTPATNYTARVKAIYGTEGESLWSSTCFRTVDANPVPTNILASIHADGATLTWNGTGDSYNVQYRTAGSTEVLFYDDFENGLDKWTTVTAGEGPGWIIENGAAKAYSYNEATYSAWAADNWLISPAVQLGGTLNFYVATVSAYPDSYEVLLSTTGTDIADFTTPLQTMATAVTGNVSIDLSAYSGTGYIAIHHLSTDMYYLAIDNFIILGPSTPAGAWQSLAVTDATATLSGLATNNGYEYQIQSVKGGETSEWSPSGEFALLTLEDATPNTSLILNNIDKQAHITLSNRTLYKNDAWNSLCLPFDVSDLTGTPLESAIVKELDTTGDYSGNSTGVNGSTLNLYFKDATSIEAGKPYFVKWASGENIVAPAFSNVIINSTSPTAVNSTDDNVTFVGNYDPISIAGEDKSILFLTTGNKLDYPNAAMTFGAFRAHFELADGVSANALVLDFGNGETTSISEKKINGEGSEGAWYMLDGRKMDNKPTQHGVYINNGRKVVIK